jgi:CheY-like chemotaxis protein
MASILIVDDDEQICALVARILENDGHEPTVAVSGREALDELRRGDFDALLIDLVMPNMGGIEAIMEIRTIAPRLPIVVMSGKVTFGDASVTRLVEHYGALAVLAKPFSSDDLRTALKQALA